MVDSDRPPIALAVLGVCAGSLLDVGGPWLLLPGGAALIAAVALFCLDVRRAR